MSFVKKPELFDARQFKGIDNLSECLAFMGERGELNIGDSNIGSMILNIHTPENTELKVYEGDYILKDSDNRLHVCNSDLFDTMFYELTEEVKSFHYSLSKEEWFKRVLALLDNFENDTGVNITIETKLSLSTGQKLMIITYTRGINHVRNYYGVYDFIDPDAMVRQIVADCEHICDDLIKGTYIFNQHQEA